MFDFIPDNQDFTLHSHSLSRKMSLEPQWLCLHTNEARKQEFLLSTQSILHSVFHFTTFLYLHFHIFRTEGIWKMKLSKSCEERYSQTSPGIPRETRAGQGQVHGDGAWATAEWTRPRPKAWQKAPYLSASTHSVQPGLFSRTAQVLFDREHYTENIRILPL